MDNNPKNGDDEDGGDDADDHDDDDDDEDNGDHVHDHHDDDSGSWKLMLNEVDSSDNFGEQQDVQKWQLKPKN